MNILMALSQLEVTGAEVYAVEIGEKLIDRGHNLYFVSDTLTKKNRGKYIPLAFNKRNLFQRLDQIIKLIKIIKQNKIDVVHAHSRASAWSAEIACRLTKTPFITTVHGMQHISKHRKRKQPIGCGYAVCENIQRDLIETFDVDPAKIKVLRNGINLTKFEISKPPKNQKKVISIIGRLSGPKADITYNLLTNSIDLKKYKINIIGGKDIPERFNKFKDRVNFTGYIDNVYEFMANSDLIIGAGRVAMESLLMGRPTLAIGEAKEIGIIDMDTVSKALASNFGDVGDRTPHDFDWNFIRSEIDRGVELKQTPPEVTDLIGENFNIDKIVDALEKTYQREWVRVNKYEIPVIMYHRVIKNIDTESGKHGTYVTTDQFRDHMTILKEGGYIPITFEDLSQIPIYQRFEKKYIILTFDDGYIDNYTYAFPILKEFGFKAVIYLVSDRTYNKWDVDLTDEKTFMMMVLPMLEEMRDSDLIEFGGHTLSHPRLSELSDDEMKEEIFKDKENTEKKLNIRLNSFAYPYGNLDDRAKKLVSDAGYPYGVATDSGSYCLSDDLFEIRRIGIFPTITNFGYKRKIHGNYNFIKIKREKKMQRDVVSG
ncbi:MULTISPECIES: polysaccharide deacetylase family protein [Psychrilyobacter]|uniref:Polysaccharide deacetylase n=1 Tax=Psychrilyobacter piezotolerans TaxID=2293438 RepID=A0ABX9KFC2_9FUSO|nr:MULTISPECIES: polysaccharide deacetylase family protein [Psychrilyobacter]MCS5421592.1 polysaccharide deacetylase family protein [Psychrilyobacter sp. S5]NDI78162.1 polysaccharide deacetylase family protein [Psychrilyobacter piezotolerans]RDE60146.1 polysaccharide deacetylase [Psychrilyobacter sp. S5]REI40328.1 polysaccharide deacetylase [Psychrilyobacter piezotolerans]